VSQFSSFSAVRIFQWLQFLKLCGYTAVHKIFIGRGGQPPQQGVGVVPQWRRAWGRVELGAAGTKEVGAGSGKGCAVAQQELIT